MIRVSLESAGVTSEHFSFLLPAFKSAFRCSRNGGPPVIRVYFVIIILELLVIVLSITYLKNIFRGWTVPLTIIFYISVLKLQNRIRL